jgi:hypothetical protein
MGCAQSVEAAVGAVYDVSGSDVSGSVVDVSAIDVSAVDVSVIAALEDLKEPTQPVQGSVSPPVTPPQGSVSPDPEPSTPAPLQTDALL